MLRIIALVVAIALGDSLNPSTIGPALYVASGDRARIGVLEFTLAVFLVHLAGGALLLLGPGQLVLSLLNGIGHTTRHMLEIAAGVTMVTAAAALWHQRGRLAHKDLPNPNPQRKSSILLGASIIAVELPTAFHTSPRSPRFWDRTTACPARCSCSPSTTSASRCPSLRY